MKRWVLIFLLGFTGSCTKALVQAQTIPVEARSRSYVASPNDVYYAVRSSLEHAGYDVASEKLEDGIITTTWIPATSDSHYYRVFDRKEYGVTGVYYMLEVSIAPDDRRTRVNIVAKTKSLAGNVTSSGIEEKKILKKVANALRRSEPSISNIGITE